MTVTIWFLIVGALLIVMALGESVLHRLPLSTSMLYLGVGFALGSGGLAFFYVDPLEQAAVLERVTEVAVLLSLFSAGLKLRVPWRDRRWLSPIRLATVSMVITVGLVTAVGVLALGLPLGGAVLLGAILAPTDPVLASDVQVESATDRDRLRFSLTGEAGMNDGAAFPFVMLGLGLLGLHELGAGGWRWVAVDLLWATVSGLGVGWLLEWFAVDVVYKLVVGLVGGILVGRLLGVIVFRTPENLRLASRGEGFVALAGTFLAYGLTEVVGGYGFLAVFVAAVALRRSESDHDYHQTLHDFAEQTEQLLMIALVVLLGGAVAGGILSPLTWQAAAVGLAVLFVVRPVTAWIGLAGTTTPKSERAAIAFFGIRGIGSLYYLAYALEHAAFVDAKQLWALVAFTVVVSILVHGTTASLVTRRLDAARETDGSAATMGA